MCHNEKYPHIRMDQQHQQRQVGVAVPSQPPPPPPPLSVFQDAGSMLSQSVPVVAGDRFLSSRPPLLVPITSGVGVGSGGSLLRPAATSAPAVAGTCFQSPPSSLKHEYAPGGTPATTPPPLTSSSAILPPDAVDFRRGGGGGADVSRTPDSDDHTPRRVTPSFGGTAAAPAFNSPRSFESRSPAVNSGPTTMPPPPPLSLLSSMSTSLEAFSNPPPFSASFSGLCRPDSGSSQTLSSPPGPPPAVHLPVPPPPHPFGFEPSPIYFGRGGATSLRNGKTEDPLEQFMEVQKSSETSKMEQLVRSIDKKLTDPNQCAVCLRTLSCKSALQMHYRTHTGERPFRCKICGRAFTTKGNLKTHMGVHRAKPPVRALHACRVCHKQFTNALVLQQHVRAHIGSDDAAHRQLALAAQPQQLHLHQLQQQAPPPAGMMMVPSSSAAAAAAAAAMTYMSPFAGYPFFPGAAAAAMAAVRYGAPRHPLQRPDFVVGGSGPRFYGSGGGRCRTASPSSDDRGDGRQDGAGDREVRAASVSMSDDDYRRRADYDDDDGDEENARDAASDGDANADDADNSANDDDSNDAVDSPLQHDASSPAADHYPHAREDVSDDELDGRRSYDLASTAVDKTAAEDRDVDDRLDRGRYLSFGDDFAVGSRYSTSLMALEEKVNEMNGRRDDDGKGTSSGSSHPLEQMERIIQRTESAAPPRVDGPDHVSSPSSTSAGLDCSMRPTPGPGSGSDQTAAAVQRGLDAINLSPTAFEAATGRPNTTCSVCYKTFACRSALDIHYRSHTKERPFTCRLCQRGFSTKGNMKQHMLTHKSSTSGLGGGADAASSIHASDGSCSSSAPDDSSGNHASVEAAGETAARDAAAAVSFDAPSTSSASAATSPISAPLAAMSAQRLPDDRAVGPPPLPPPPRATSPSRRLPNLRHMCQVCQKPFSSASALQIHMRTHTGDKPFSCTVCGKAFTTKGNLKVHMGTHVWNSVPSRRGRRMSVDGLQPPPGCHPGTDPGLLPHHPVRSPNLGPPPPPPPSDYLAGARLPTSGIYPFPFPFGSNGFGPGSIMASKLNEISVIQNRMMAPGAAGPPALQPGALPDAVPRLPHGLSAIFSPQHAFAAAAAMRLPVPVSFHKTAGGPDFRADRRDVDNNNAPAGMGEKTGHSGELDLSLKKTQMPPAPCPRYSLLCCCVDASNNR